jgi:hypothetical protein
MDFRFENKPSGNPALVALAVLFCHFFIPIIFHLTCYGRPHPLFIPASSESIFKEKKSLASIFQNTDYISGYYGAVGRGQKFRDRFFFFRFFRFLRTVMHFTCPGCDLHVGERDPESSGLPDFSCF